MGVRYRAAAGAILRCPLMRAGRALGQFPFIAEQVREEIVAPLGRRLGPNDFQAATDGVTALARAKFALPAEALLLNACGFGLCADQFGISSTMGLAEGVTARNQRDRFLIV